MKSLSEDFVLLNSSCRTEPKDGVFILRSKIQQQRSRDEDKSFSREKSREGRPLDNRNENADCTDSPFPFFFSLARKREWINSTLFVFGRDRNLWRRGANTRRAASMGKMGRRRDVKIRRKQIFEARRGRRGGCCTRSVRREPGENSSGQRVMWREGCLVTRSFKTLLTEQAGLSFFTRFPSLLLAIRIFFIVSLGGKFIDLDDFDHHCRLIRRNFS